MICLKANHNPAKSRFYNSLSQFGRIEDIWPWLRETILPNVYPESHYNGDPLGGYDRQFMYNIDALRMGPIRLKQNRDQDSEFIQGDKMWDLELKSKRNV